MMVAKSRAKTVALGQSDLSWAVLVKQDVDPLLPAKVGNPKARTIFSDPAKQSKLVSNAFSRKPFDLIGSPKESETRD